MQSRLSKNAAYQCWSGMVQRCTNPKSSGWNAYGGAGIRVFDGWLGREGFLAFIAHIGERPSAIHQIDRIDGRGGYVPGNVRWATPVEQSRNKSSNVIIEHNGDRFCLAEWAERIGISRQSLQKRLERWDVGRALSERKFTHHGPRPTERSRRLRREARAALAKEGK